MDKSIEDLVNEIDIGIDLKNNYPPCDYDNRLYLIGDDGMIVYSDDMGKSWIPYKDSEDFDG